MTEDAEPTMTSPMRQSRTTSRSNSVETETRWLPMRMPSPSVRAAWRCANERGAVSAVFVLVAGTRRGRGVVCRSDGAILRVNVTTPPPSGRGRAALPGPTPDA